MRYIARIKRERLTKTEEDVDAEKGRVEMIARMTIKEWQVYINEWCTRKGWNENLVLGNMIANLHSEISEAWEEIRNGKQPNEIWYSEDNVLCYQKKPEGFPIELADLAIRLLHICEYIGVDLEEMIAFKMKYNETRSYRHGGKTA